MIATLSKALCHENISVEGRAQDWKMQNCFGGLAKFLVVFTNLVVFVAGCVSTGFGIYYLVVDDLTPLMTGVR